jgi:hypothetical protein
MSWTCRPCRGGPRSPTGWTWRVGVPDLPTLFRPGAGGRPADLLRRLHSQNPANCTPAAPPGTTSTTPTTPSRGEGSRRGPAAAAAGAERGGVFFNNCVGTQACGERPEAGRLARRRPRGLRVVDRAAGAAERGLDCFDDGGDRRGRSLLAGTNCRHGSGQSSRPARSRPTADFGVRPDDGQGAEVLPSHPWVRGTRRRAPDSSPRRAPGSERTRTSPSLR